MTISHNSLCVPITPLISMHKILRNVCENTGKQDLYKFTHAGDVEFPYSVYDFHIYCCYADNVLRFPKLQRKTRQIEYVCNGSYIMFR